MKQDGFSLLEVLVSIVFLTISSLALLQGLTVAFQSYSLARTRWKDTLELWNKSENIRAQPPLSGEFFQAMPGARPLYRIVLDDPSNKSNQQWEVLRAQK
ncbi:MAG: type IV pilus modification PilV family protein [Acidobacteriota bacterium]